MTRADAEKLGSFVLDAGLDASIIPIERGDVFCLCLTTPQWFIWSFDDWQAFVKEGKQYKKQRNGGRRKVAAAV